MSSNAPIGVYDSGFGGLSVWRELRRLLPAESLVYLGDGKNCPYGGRSREEIEGFAYEAVERLVREGVKMVVVGCNTATTAAVESLRQRWCDMPIVGLEPAVKPACLATRTRKIAVLATEHSLSSNMFLATAARYAEEETGCTVTIDINEGTPPVINPPALLEKVCALLPVRLLDAPSMTAEDFSEYQQRVPGLFFFLGLGDVPALHSDTFDFDETILTKGADFFEALAEQFQ